VGGTPREVVPGPKRDENGNENRNANGTTANPPVLLEMYGIGNGTAPAVPVGCKAASRSLARARDTGRRRAGTSDQADRPWPSTPPARQARRVPDRVAVPGHARLDLAAEVLRKCQPRHAERPQVSRRGTCKCLSEGWGCPGGGCRDRDGMEVWLSGVGRDGVEGELGEGVGVGRCLRQTCIGRWPLKFGSSRRLSRLGWRLRSSTHAAGLVLT